MLLAVWGIAGGVLGDVEFVFRFEGEAAGLSGAELLVFSLAKTVAGVLDGWKEKFDDFWVIFGQFRKKLVFGISR
jgi:hypothetical protein